MCRWVHHNTFVKALDGVVSQSHKELCSPAEAECQGSAGLSCLLYQAKSSEERSNEIHKAGQM